MNRKGTRAASLIEYLPVILVFDLSLAVTARPGVPFFYANPFFISCGDEAKKCQLAYKATGVQLKIKNRNQGELMLT